MEKRTRISIILTIVSLCFYVCSITFGNFTIDDLGVITGIEPFFIVSLVLLTIGSMLLWKNRTGNGLLLLVQVLLLSCMLWLTPLMLFRFSGTPGITVSFDYYGLIDTVVRSGHIDTTISSFLNWPSQAIVSAMLMDIMGAQEPYLYIALYPFICQFLFGIPVYLILRKTFIGKEYPNIWVAGIWLFELINWSPENKLSSQSIGLFIIYLFLFIILKYWDKMTRDRLVMIILLSVFIVITHFVSSILCIIFFVLLFLFLRRRNSVSLGLTSISVIVLFLWVFYVMTAFFERNLVKFTASAFRLDYLIDAIFNRSTISGMSSSEVSFYISMTILVSTVVLVLITGLAFLLQLRQRDENRSIMFLYAAGVVTATLANTFSYSTEILYRGVLFLFPFIVFYCLHLLKRKRLSIVFYALVFCSLPVFFINHYGGLASGHTTQAQISGMEYIAEKVDAGTVLTVGEGKQKGIVSNAENFLRPRFGPRDNPEYYPDSDLFLQYIDDRITVNDGLYIVLGSEDVKNFNYMYGNGEYIDIIQRTIESDGYARIYASNTLGIWYKPETRF